MRYVNMTAFELGHTAPVLSFIEHISRTQLHSLLPQMNWFNFFRKLNRDGNSPKKQISSMLRSWRKKNLEIFCFVRQVTGSGSFANRNNLMGGVIPISMGAQFTKKNYSIVDLGKKVT